MFFSSNFKDMAYMYVQVARFSDGPKSLVLWLSSSHLLSFVWGLVLDVEYLLQSDPFSPFLEIPAAEQNV